MLIVPVYVNETQIGEVRIRRLMELEGANEEYEYEYEYEVYHFDRLRSEVVLEATGHVRHTYSDGYLPLIGKVAKSAEEGRASRG